MHANSINSTVRSAPLAQGAKLPKGREEEMKEAPPAQPPLTEAQEAVVAALDARYREQLKEHHSVQGRLRLLPDI